jgi:hypothetical protein
MNGEQAEQTLLLDFEKHNLITKLLTIRTHFQQNKLIGAEPREA